MEAPGFPLASSIAKDHMLEMSSEDSEAAVLKLSMSDNKSVPHVSAFGDP